MSTTPTAYALLSDCHSAALVNTSGSVEWLCFPRFDSPSTFARLLDDAAGHWSIRPRADATVTRRYLERTMVVETTFRTPTGAVTLTDALGLGAGNRDHDIGRGSPHVMLRQVTGLEGDVEVEVEFAPRTEYGLIHPLLSVIEGGIAARGGADSLVLSSPVDLKVDGATATGRFVVRAGDRVGFALHHRSTGEAPATVWSQQEIAERLDDTIAAWRSWSALHQNYQGPYHHLVHHSGRVLQALTFRPTGAIVAAATTSLETKHTYPGRITPATLAERFGRIVPYFVINTGMLPHQFTSFVEGLFGPLHSEFERTPKAASVTSTSDPPQAPAQKKTHAVNVLWPYVLTEAYFVLYQLGWAVLFAAHGLILCALGATYVASCVAGLCYFYGDHIDKRCFVLNRPPRSPRDWTDCVSGTCPTVGEVLGDESWVPLTEGIGQSRRGAR